MKIGQNVTSEFFTGEGKILESHGNEFLVEHEINTDGKSKKIQQWYIGEILIGVLEEEEIEDKMIVLSDDKVVDNDVISFVNGSKVTTVKTKNVTRVDRSKSKIELGVTPNDEEIKEEK